MGYSPTKDKSYKTIDNDNTFHDEEEEGADSHTHGGHGSHGHHDDSKAL